MSTLEFVLLAVYVSSTVLTTAAYPILKRPYSPSENLAPILGKLVFLAAVVLVLLARPAALIWLGVHLLGTGNLIGAALALTLLLNTVIRYIRKSREAGKPARAPREHRA